MRHRCTALHILIATAWLLLGSGTSAAQEPASASTKSAVVVIDAGTVDLFVESLVRSTVEAELTKNGYRIVSGVSVGGDMPAKLLGCSGDLACAAAVMSGIAANTVVFLSLRTEDPGETAEFKIVARSFEVASGRAIARVMRRCERCVEDLVLANFTETVVDELVKEVRSPEPAPEEAPVQTPAETTSSPPRSADVIVAPEPARPEEGPGWVAIASYASLGAGVAAIAAGTVLVLVDGPVIGNGLREPEANDTLALGFVSLGTGVALVGLGAWLWTARDQEHASPLVLRASSHGASLGFSGEF